jgi:hypothetical protein
MTYTSDTDCAITCSTPTALDTPPRFTAALAIIPHCSLTHPYTKELNTL